MPPVPGVFKGRRQQRLNVQVRVMRTEVTTEQRAGFQEHRSQNKEAGTSKSTYVPKL
jgi:hypothetical protein